MAAAVRHLSSSSKGRACGASVTRDINASLTPADDHSPDRFASMERTTHLVQPLAPAANRPINRFQRSYGNT
jgi:hypothetical protein